MAPAIAPAPAPKNRTALTAARSLVLGPQRRALQRLGQEHLLGEDEIGAVVVGELVVVAHRDRVERARQLAVAAEDAARQVNLIHRGVALARGSAGTRAPSPRGTAP